MKTAITDVHDKLFCGLDDTFTVPMSRHTELDEAAIGKNRDLIVLAWSEKTGSAVIRSCDGRRVFATGHSEYDRDSPWRRSTSAIRTRGWISTLPENYFPNDNPAMQPRVNWHAHASLLFSNWLNYFVYQETPYDLREGTCCMRRI